MSELIEMEQFALAQEAVVLSTSIGSSEDNLQIDWDTRKIIIPSTVTNAGVRFDHLAKKLVFEMEREVAGVDLAEHTFAIHFINAEKWEGMEKWEATKMTHTDFASGIYPVTSIDLSVAGKVICEWDITNASTQIAGTVAFALHVFTILDSNFTYHIGTEPAALALPNTISATEHGENVTPAEIEVYIQKMDDLISSIDEEAILAASRSTATNAASVTKAASEVKTAAATTKEAKTEAIEAAEQAKTYAGNAQAVSGVQIATPEVAGLVKGGDNYIDEGGTLWLTRQTTEHSLPYSHAGGLKVNEIGGASEQVSTTGAQLLDISVLNNITANGVTWTIADGYLTANGTASSYSTRTIPLDLPNGQYALNGKKSAEGIIGYCLRVYTSDTEYTNYFDSYTVDGTEVKIHAIFIIGTGYTVTNATIYPMLNAGDTALPWEPYTGGAPSPSPDYPQEIKSVVVSEVKTVGKNLIKNTAKTQTINGITFTVNKDGSVTTNGTATDAVAYNLAYTSRLKDGEQYILNGCPSGGSNTTYRLDCFYSKKASKNDTGKGKMFIAEPGTLTVRIYIAAGVTISNITYYPMIRSASIEDDSYEPFQESVITLSEPVTLHGIGDVKDRIVRKNGVWGVERRLEEVVYNGASSESWSLRNESEGTYLFHETNVKLKIGDYSANYLCTHSLPNSTGMNSTQIGSYVYSKRFRIRVPANVATTVEEFTEWITNNPVTVICISDVETDATPLPTADQIALHSLATFDTITHIYHDSVIEPVIDVEYGTSKAGAYALEAWNTSKRNEINVNSMQSAILSLGGNV